MVRQLIEFCLARRLASNSSVISTHFIRDKCFQVDRRTSHGGELTVNSDNIDAFLDAYTNSVLSGGQISLYEQPGDTFKQFFCLMVKDISEECIRAIVNATTETLSDFYEGFPSSAFECI